MADPVMTMLGELLMCVQVVVTVVTFMHVRQRIYDTWRVAHTRSRLVFRESMIRARSAMVSVLPPGIDLRKLQRSHSRVDRYPVY